VGDALIVIDRVALNCALWTTSSPGMGPATSASVAPHRKCHRRISGLTTHMGTADSVSKVNASLLLGEVISATSRLLTD
jgi:hypothetical protein